VPTIEIKMQVEIELQYDPFDGRTPAQFAELIHDDVIESLWEMRPDSVEALYTDVKEITTINDGVIAKHEPVSV